MDSALLNNQKKDRAFAPITTYPTDPRDLPAHMFERAYKKGVPALRDVPELGVCSAGLRKSLTSWKADVGEVQVMVAPNPNLMTSMVQMMHSDRPKQLYSRCCRQRLGTSTQNCSSCVLEPCRAMRLHRRLHRRTPLHAVTHLLRKSRARQLRALTRRSPQTVQLRWGGRAQHIVREFASPSCVRFDVS